MTISMYQASVPVLVRMLGNLSAILTKAAAYAEAKKIEPRVLARPARLAPDMLSPCLTRQVQIATDMAKGCGALAAADLPKYEDNEASFQELRGPYHQDNRVS